MYRHTAKPRSRTVTLSCSVLLIAGLICSYLWTVEPDLTKIGHKHTELGEVDETEASVFWIGNDRLLLFSPRHDEYDNTPGVPQTTVVQHAQICMAYRLQKGVFERDPQLSLRLQKLDMAEILPQKDGSSLLWFPHNGALQGTPGDYARPHLCNLNTGKDLALPHLTESNLQRLLVLMDRDRLLRIKQVGSVGYDTLFPLDIVRRQILPSEKLPKYAKLPPLAARYWEDKQTVGVSKGHLLLVDWYTDWVVSHVVLFHLFRLQAPSSLERETRVHLPLPARIQQIAISPQLTHVAWILNTEYHPPLDTTRRWLHLSSNGMPLSTQSQMVRAFDALPMTKLSLWLSKADGSDMHEIGRFSSPGTNIGDIHWLPDGSQISLVIDRSLYTIPIR
jgi:hypothetical protein